MHKNSCLSQLKPGSAAYVVAHARWKRSRGRNPSLPYGNEKNPLNALALAKLDLETDRARHALAKTMNRRKGARYSSNMDGLAAFGFLINAMGGGGDRDQSFPHSDAEELSRGCHFIPGEVTMARRRGDKVEFHNDCNNSCCWYWQFPDGTRVYHWDRGDHETMTANGRCSQCGNRHINGGTVSA